MRVDSTIQPYKFNIRYFSEPKKNIQQIITNNFKKYMKASILIESLYYGIPIYGTYRTHDSSV